LLEYGGVLRGRHEPIPREQDGAGIARSQRLTRGPRGTGMRPRLRALVGEGTVPRKAVRGLRRLRSRVRRRRKGVRAENVVWIFGTGRSGSTWLASMMASLDDHALWNEPLVGNLFGNFYYFRAGGRRLGKHSILGEAYKETWLGPMRDMVLGGAAARFPEITGEPGGYLVVRSPTAP